MQNFPISLEHKDMIDIAATGYSESAAFLIPLITYLSTLPKQDNKICKDGPYALIMAPLSRSKKEYLIKSGQNVPPELAQHMASKQKPGSVPDNVPRRKQIILAHLLKIENKYRRQNRLKIYIYDSKQKIRQNYINSISTI
ncbi:unnamed protein product (macronuclear) [Paramecium tetraurelia]|uniref:Uncharacterized protein n=1 Tax=Paramecium tetraurelia TaxID=5888 RepID=A0DW23_PARTE|nr:uncharacterized protein GSPATT00020893001 [Paramecium tetraurelia]CAK87240.1 unnamed protein product [Paramecium tetraurelia]|eukprot:XP_001454637.1 hypothetical protein (macronuclear) [Paramecium tetraurelia strain d4-2]